MAQMNSFPMSRLAQAMRQHGLVRFVEHFAAQVQNEIGRKAKAMIVVRHNIETMGRTVPPWLESAGEGASVTVRDLPMREHIDVPVREQLIVELYSK